MSKKIILLALAVVSAALFALPAMAAANEDHVEGATGKAFTGSGAGGNLTAEGEPTIACTKTAASGSFTSETTGNVNQTFSGCSTTILGVKVGCKTSGAEAETIKLEQVFHLITIDGEKGGIILTPPFPTLICGSGLSERKLQVGGNGIIGTVTSPACGASSKSVTVSFTATAGNQEHKLYTGNTYDLTNSTESGGSPVTAGITGSATLSFNDGMARKLVCT